MRTMNYGNYQARLKAEELARKLSSTTWYFLIDFFNLKFYPYTFEEKVQVLIRLKKRLEKNPDLWQKLVAGVDKYSRRK